MLNVTRNGMVVEAMKPPIAPKTAGPLRRVIGFGAVLALAVLARAAVAEAAPVRIYAAGSLSGVMKDLMAASGLPSSTFAEPVFGPAGLLGERLAKGETADLFASADMAQPTRVAATDSKVFVIPFALNRMCVSAKPSVGLTAGNILDRLLSSDVRLATSTPVADPGGDYALAVFDRAEALRGGAAAALTAKALHLLGGPNTMVPVAGHSPAASIFVADRADALLYYCSSSKAVTSEVEGLVTLPVPEELEVHPTYGMAILSNDPDTARFALFMLSVTGQEILARAGFLPIAAR